MGNRGKQIKPTKNSHLVSDKHTCKGCGQTKKDVNFRVNTGFGTYHPELFCNHCRPKGDYNIKRTKLGSDRTKVLCKQFKDYFEQNI